MDEPAATAMAAIFEEKKPLSRFGDAGSDLGHAKTCPRRP
jgi:hypothetical protein